MRKLFLLTALFIAVPVLAQTVIYTNGFETGDIGEMSSGAGLTFAAPATGMSGAYMAVVNASGGRLFTGKAASFGAGIGLGFKLQHHAACQTSDANIVVFQASTGTTQWYLQSDTACKLKAIDNSTTIGLSAATATHAMDPATTYSIEVAYDQAAGGVLKVWMNGTLEIDTTHSTAAAAIDRIYIYGFGTTTKTVYWDDFIVVTGPNRPAQGRVVARQPIIGGTPTYDAWTKSTGADCGAIWDDTPISATDYCSSSTANQQQTAVISSFGSTQTGHGTETIATGSTINGCKTIVNAKAAAAVTMSILRRVGASDTLTSKTLTTSDAFYDDGFWTTTVANLANMEAGAKQTSNTNLETVEDVWVSCHYTPAPPVTAHGNRGQVY